MAGQPFSFLMLRSALLLLALSCASAQAADGLLDRFERDATTPRSNSKQSAGNPSGNPSAKPAGNYGSGGPHRAGEHDAGGLHPAVLIPYFLSIGGEYSVLRMRDNPQEAGPRQAGEALLPLLRVDFNGQYISDKVSATDARLEAGWGPLALQGRFTRFREEQAGSTAALLDVNQVHVLYRMSLGDYVEWDIGYGALEMAGKARSQGDSVASPILIHPSPHWGLEYRPSWSEVNGNTVRDQEFALLLGARFVSVRLGYRRLESSVGKGGAILDGPFAGIALRY